MADTLSNTYGRTREWIGPRIIPVFADEVQWDEDANYEPLMMVQNQGETFMSRQYVPAGEPLPDVSSGVESTDYWVHMSNWNAQVEAYREEVMQYAQEVLGFSGDIEALQAALPIADFDATNTVKAALDAITADNWVTSNRIATDAVTTAKIADENVTTAKIADSNVTTAKIADENVTTAKIADDAVTSDKIPDGAITRKHLNEDVKRPRILAHRGISTMSDYYFAIDNSLWSYMGAFANGFEGFECDVRRDVNGVIVMLHDADVNTVSNSSGNINTLDYQNVFYKTRYIEATTNTRLTTLRDMAQLLYAFDGFAYIEIKDTTISAQDVANVMLQEGLTYENFACFSLDDNWFNSNIGTENVLIGYQNNNYTATQAEINALKTVADSVDKPYDEIVIRVTYPEYIENINANGFKNCLDSNTENYNMYSYKNLDYAIAQNQWNGNNAPDANHRITVKKYTGEETLRHTTMQSFLNALTRHDDAFFGYVTGGNFYNNWLPNMTVTGTTPAGFNNGCMMVGTTTYNFVAGELYAMRGTSRITFTYEFATGTLNARGY